tara:strand:- start:2160 stop:2960 length:801 start_codon:yes stop_codon:yes gene_type:complete
MKQKINMVGGGFQHEVCSSAGSIPKLIEWVKGAHTAPISIHIDSGISNIKVNKNKKNYAWLSESKTIIGGVYKWCINNLDYLNSNFELIFTHDKSLLPLSNKFKLVICNARPWVKECGVHKKSKEISMIASSKVMCDEHRYRQKIINKFKNKLDLYGRGFNPINIKDVGLKDYRFSIAMENGDYSLMYTEKITDCFAMGTIPIYYGSNDICEVFDSNGIITLNDSFKISDLNKDLYESKMSSIRKNYEITMNMQTVEDYIYENFIK